MNQDTGDEIRSPLAGVNSQRLFVGSCFALIATSVAFAMVGDIMGALKVQFALNNEAVGWIGGAALWGFTLSIIGVGPLCDAIGMRALLRFAAMCHLAGVLLMISTPWTGAAPFWSLFIGALVIALGNGTVEAVCNPLVATIYPQKKTEKLNQFHVWFPGGIVIGGLIAFALTKVKLDYWQLKIGVVLLATLIYAGLFTAQKFPATERVQSGVSFAGMFKETLLRPLFLLLLFCMMITASLELGPNRWIPAVLKSGGIPGILVLVWISGLMAVLRYYAGPVIGKLSNSGTLVLSAILGGAGLFWLSYTESTVMAFVAATVFAVGVCYFWPTILGTAAERVPKGGALALALLGGIGMAIVGLVASPMMGKIADSYAHKRLVKSEQKVVATLETVSTTYSQLRDNLPAAVQQKDMNAALNGINDVLEEYKQTGELPAGGKTAEALRSAEKVGPTEQDVESSNGEEAREFIQAKEAKEDAAEIVNPADNYGGLMSFRWVAPFSIIIIVIFGALYVHDRARKQKTGAEPPAESATDEPVPIE